MPTKPRDVQALRTRILVAGALVIAALVGSAVYDAWRLHAQMEITNHRALANLARALANEARRNFESVDVLLRDTAQWYSESAHTLSPQTIQQGLAARASGLSQVSVLTIVDANGNQRFRSRMTQAPLANVADRPYFSVQRDAQARGLFINEPIVTRTEKLPSIVMSRRMATSDGSFLGVVTAIVTLEEFQEMYATLQVNDASALILTLDDGTLIVRHPPLPERDRQTRFAQLASLKSGDLVDRAISPLDGRTKLVAALPVGNQPLIIAMTRDEEASFSPWYNEMRSAAIRTALLSALVIVTMHGVLRQLRKSAAAEQALRASEARYAMTMDAADSGHAEWNMQADTIFLSPRWRSLHGITDAAATATLHALVAAVPMHPDDKAAVSSAVQGHLAGKSPSVEIEYRVRHPDGKWRWIHARAKRLLDDSGAPSRIFCAAADVTDRHEAVQANLELERRRQETQRLEALGTLAGGIAHDFNNILGAILGFGEMAQQKAASGSDLHRHLTKVMQAGDRARVLVRRILDFSRSGVIERSPVHLQSVVEEVLAALSPSPSSGVTLSRQLAAGDTAVSGDATQLYQVTMNLCVNALQAMGSGGTLAVRLHLQALGEERRFFHGSLPAGRYVVLDVCDTGTGIAADVLQSMFHPFFTTRKGIGGTGLGLSVVHGVVADHGGAIDVVSEVGTGTTVSVWLPAAGTCEPNTPEQALDLVQGQGQTVMVVDDERVLVELAEELLAGLGYEPVGFDSAEAALDAFQREPERFDALLTDEMLPAMPGSELAARVRAVRPALPVVVMSGKVTADLEARLRAVGVDTLLHKPLRMGQVANALSRALGSDTLRPTHTFAGRPP